MFRELSQFLLRRNISQIVFEWQEANRLALVALCVVCELSLQWLGYSLIWFSNAFDSWVNSDAMGLLWIVSGQVILVFFVILFYAFNNDNKSLKWLQHLMITVYLIYMATTYVSFGVVNIFVGVSLLSNTIIASLLMTRRLVWNAFLLQLLFIGILILLPAFGINLDNVYVVDIADKDQYQASFFWLFFLIYLSLPKAFLTVGVCFHLLKGIENRLNNAEYHANYDELTQVANRRYITNHLYQSLFLAKSNSKDPFDLEHLPQDFSVIILDIDFFKSINDTYGHLSGDLVLIEVANRLKNMMTQTGWKVSRHGGEEFLVVLPQAPHSLALEIAGQLHRNIGTKKYQIIDGMYIDATASFGVASFSHEEVVNIREQYFLEHHEEEIQDTLTKYASRVTHDNKSEFVKASPEDLIIESLINMADSALYDAKRLGRNRIVSANQYVDVENSESSIQKNIVQADFILRDVPIE